MIDLADLRAKAEAAKPAYENLQTCQRQLDMDGCMVGVSRQALDESLAALSPATVLALIDMAEALMFISKRARSDEDRTFDDCIRDLGWIDDECRRVLPPPPEAKEG